MPRQATIGPADLADAAIAVVVRVGIDGLTVRAVAAEAGVSVGAVQHHLATKDAMLLAAYDRVIALVAARVDERLRRARSVRGALLAVLSQLVPADAERAGEGGVALAFMDRSRHHPSLAELYGQSVAALHRAVEDALRAGGIAEPAREARALVGLADGVGLHALCAPAELTPREAQRIIERAVDALLERAET